MKKRLSQAFFARNPEIVARELLGKVLIRQIGGTRMEGVILETEAYGGADDPASHAFKSKTARNWPMFEAAGLTYVYFIYGMHYCFNVSTGRPGEVGAVLIRGVFNLCAHELVSGPGKVGKLYGFTLKESGISVLQKNGPIYFEDRGIVVEHVQTTSRIGIHKAIEKQWRFVGELPSSLLD